MKTLFLMMILALPLTGQAKVQPDEQIWVNLNGFFKLNESYQLYLEAQPRFIDYHSRFGTTLYRSALGKNLGQGFSAWAGYGFIERANPTHLHEDRPFLQLMHSHDVSEQLKVINRTRGEARYFRGARNPSLRLRHLLRAQYLLSGKWAAIVYDEWFWNANSVNSSLGVNEGFDQNRMFAGIGYFLGPHLAELGYVNQYVNGSGSDSSNHVLSLQVTFRY